MIFVAMEICERSQFSVEAGGLFSNMADFHGRHHFEFLIRFLIGSWVLKINYATDLVTWIRSGLLIGQEPFQLDANNIYCHLIG